MSDLSLAIQKEVVQKLASKAVVVNGRGTLSVDGTTLDGLDGQRALRLFSEGVEQDIKERGLAGAEKLYRAKSRTPGGLGHALHASVNLSRMLDADQIAG